MPSASVRIAISVNPGFLASIRRPYRTSSKSIFNSPRAPVAISSRARKSGILNSEGPSKGDTPLLQADPVEVVPGGHVGEDHFVSDLQSLHDFDRIHRTPPQLYIDAHGFRSVINNLENPDGAVRLPVYGPADIKHVLQILQFHRS